MTRVKRGVVAHKKRERRLKATKGFRWSRRTKEKAAKEALTHAYTHMFRGRKERKRDFRALWNVKINAAIRPLGMNYNQFISALKKKSIKLELWAPLVWARDSEPRGGGARNRKHSEGF